MVPTGVRVRGLTKRYGPVAALAGVDLEFGAGEVSALVGANGAGKTTLLGVLAGLVRPDGGEILVAGEPFDRRRSDHRARVGFVAHETFLYRALSSRENLMLHARIHALERPAESVSEAMDRFELAARADVPVGNLSRGWRQRAALARAILHRPSLLLLDEPFTGLDLRAARLLSDSLRALVSPERAIVVTTHGSVREFADRVLVLDRGRVVHEGDASALDASALEAVLAPAPGDPDGPVAGAGRPAAPRGTPS